MNTLFDTSKLTNRQLRAHFAIRGAHKPVEALSPEVMAAKYSRCHRMGKTYRDYANGYPHRREQRRQARAAWVRETSCKHYSSAESVPAFPV